MTRTRKTPLQMTPTPEEWAKVHRIKNALHIRYNAEVLHLILAEFDLETFLAARSTAAQVAPSDQQQEATTELQSAAA